MIPDIAVFNGFWYFVALIFAMIAWRIWGDRVMRALRKFEQDRRDADLQTYFDRMNPNAHFRQSVDQIGEQTPAVEGVTWNGDVYESREDAEAARWRHIITEARSFYIDLDRTYGNRIRGPNARNRVDGQKAKAAANMLSAGVYKGPMRRADRLFQIIQILRRARGPVTADAIAAELETSKRSVYRDVATLMGQRVPIRGEAGMGYVLESGFDLPPLMLTPDEIEAAVLGAQFVTGRGDPMLAKAAQDLIAKISVAIPERLRPLILEPSIGASTERKIPPDAIDMVTLRNHIRHGRKVALKYRDEKGRESARNVWPVTIAYMETVRMLAAWCELRKDFRHFRTDRIVTADFLEDRYPERPTLLRAKWRKMMKDKKPVDT